MAYSSTNPPHLMTQLITGQKIFSYSSTENSTTVATLGFFTDGIERGMAAGDLLISRNSSSGTITMHLVISATLPSTAGLVIGDPTTIGSTSNTA